MSERRFFWMMVIAEVGEVVALGLLVVSMFLTVYGLVVLEHFLSHKM